MTLLTETPSQSRTQAQAAPTFLRPEQIEFYKLHGWLRIPGRELSNILSGGW